MKFSVSPRASCDQGQAMLAKFPARRQGVSKVILLTSITAEGTNWQSRFTNFNLTPNEDCKQIQIIDRFGRIHRQNWSQYRSFMVTRFRESND